MFHLNQYVVGRDPVVEVTRQLAQVKLAGIALKRELVEFVRSHGSGANLSAWVDPEGLVAFTQHAVTTKRYIETAAREGIWTNHPIIVGYSKSTGKVTVMDGNHRLNAAYYLGLAQVAAYVRVFD